jgi:hypothetical protein
VLSRHDYSDFDLETVLSSTREDTQTEMANSRRAAKVFLQKSKLASMSSRRYFLSVKHSKDSKVTFACNFCRRAHDVVSCHLRSK